MGFELSVCLIMVALDGRVLDRAVHSLNLAIDSVMVHLYQAMLDPVLRANPVEDVLHRIAILFTVCELDIVVGEDRVDPVGQRRDEIAQELGSPAFFPSRTTANLEVRSMAANM